MIGLWIALAGAAELTCDYRGLQATVRWEVDGHIELIDGDEVLTVVAGSPMDPDTAAGSCRGEGARFVWGGDEQITMSVQTQSVDFGPLLDVLSAARFDPSQAPFRRARYHGKAGNPEGVWKWVGASLDTLTEPQAVAVAGWLASSEELKLLEAAWRLTPEALRQADDGVALGVRVAEGRLATGSLDEADALFAQLEPRSTAACMGRARVLEERGRKGPARKQRAACEGDG
jgi:hypothetical protein